MVHNYKGRVASFLKDVSFFINNALDDHLAYLQPLR